MPARTGSDRESTQRTDGTTPTGTTTDPGWPAPLLPATRAARSRASALLAVGQPGPRGLAVKSRGAELAVRRFDHDRRTGSDGAPRPLADEGAQGQDVLVSGSGNVTQCSPGWART